MRLQLIRVQIAAASGVNEHNQDLLKGLADDYTGLLFPGIEKGGSVDTFEQQAKKMLAKEVKKVYRVTRINEKSEREEAMKKIIGTGGAGGAMATKATLEEQREIDNVRRRYGSSKK